MKRFAIWTLPTGLLAAALGGAGCNDATPPAKTPGPSSAVAATPTGHAPTPAPASSIDSESQSAPVNIDEKVRKLCDLPDAHFDFNSSAVGASAASVLDKLATCFVSGPAVGKNLAIEGHADPRGPADYNVKLGHRRAASVAEYLMKKGMQEKRIATSSKGATEATGTDEAGYAKDRKVKIYLADD